MDIQPKTKRSMRCIYCGSLSTKKNGKRTITSISFDRKTTKQIQRYRCNRCKRSFTKRRAKGKHYTVGFREQIVRMHVEERMSFRVISKRLYERYAIKISAGYLCKIFNQTISKVKSSKQIKEEFQPKWSGYLVVDDKMIKVKGEEKLSLIAKDISGDIVHQELLDYQQQDRYDDFIKFIKLRLDYQFKSITTDLDPMLAKAIKTVLAEGCPHQLCLKHTMDNIYRLVKYQQIKRKLNKLIKENKFKSKDSLVYLSEIKQLEEELQKIEDMITNIKKFLWNKDRGQSEEILEDIVKRYSIDYPEVVDLLLRHKNGLLAHQLDENIPKTNNDAENTNKQIKRRLKTIESFQSIRNADNYLAVMCNYLKMKPYTDCRGKRKYRNGYSPLQLCGVNINSKNWVRLSLNL